PEATATKVIRRLYLLRYYAIICLVGVLIAALFLWAEVGQPPSPPARKETASPNKSITETCTAMSVPDHGTYRTYPYYLTTKSPFEIRTRPGSNYFVKLEYVLDERR